MVTEVNVQEDLITLKNFIPRVGKQKEMLRSSSRFRSLRHPSLGFMSVDTGLLWVDPLGHRKGKVEEWLTRREKSEWDNCIQKDQ